MKKFNKPQIRKIRASIPRVENMQSANGNDVPNQFKIYTPGGVYFQSYNTIIAFKPVVGPIVLDENRWDYSVTTGKYRNQFLNEGISDTRKGIQSGVYQLANLN